MKKKIEELQKQLDKLKAEFEANQKTKIDFSILNDTDWFYVEYDRNNHFKWLLKGIKVDPIGCIRPKDSYCDADDDLRLNRPQDELSTYVGTKDRVSVLRKATETDLAPLFKKHPHLAPPKVGDWGIFWDNDDIMCDAQILQQISPLGNIIAGDETEYCMEGYAAGWENFHKVDHTKSSLKEIVEQYKYVRSHGNGFEHFHKIDTTQPLNEIIENFRKEVGK